MSTVATTRSSPRRTNSTVCTLKPIDSSETVARERNHDDDTGDPALDVRPQSGWTGAEISGVDLTAPLRDDQVAEIRAALLKWKVVFFRDQFISHDDHLRFARAFGAPTPAHPLFDCDSRSGLSDDLPDLPGPVQGSLPRHQRIRQAELARRRHRGGESARRIDPARRGHPAVRGRHPVVQHRRRLRGAVGAAAPARRRVACGAPLLTAGRRDRHRRLSAPGRPADHC